MKIGIVTTWFERGAAYVSKQYMDLLEKKHDVYIYARGGESYAKNNPIWDLENVTWGKKKIFQINATPIDKRDFINWINTFNIEIILFNEQQWWIPVIWAKEEGVKVGAYIDYYTKETVPLFSIYDFLICNTKRHYSVFQWHKECYYVSWGTYINIFNPKEKRLEDKKKVVFFNSSGFNPDRKGVYPLIQAFYKLESKHKKLLLHSQVNLKKYYADIAFMVEELEENQQLEIISETISSPGLYHFADVYCYISKLDGIGLTLPEAISCGLQAIVPDNAPMNEFVKEGVNGKLVKVKSFNQRNDSYYWDECEIDIEDLIVKMQFYLDQKEKIHLLKEKSRKYAIQNLNWINRESKLNNIFLKTKSYPVDAHIKEKIILYEYEKLKHLSVLNILKNIYKTIKR